MRIEHLDDDRNGTGTLLIEDGKLGIAVVIDPGPEIARYLRAAEQNGLRLAHVFLTHLPDGERGAGLALWQRFGVNVHASSRVPRKFGLLPLLDGSSLRFGDLRLEFRHATNGPRDALRIRIFELDGEGQRPVGTATPERRRVA